MTRAVDEANRRLGAVRRMAQGAARIEAAERESRLIDAEGPEGARAYALMVLVEAYHWGGEVDRAFVAFARLVQWFDERPDQFDDYDRGMLFWQFKWTVSSLAEFPTVSAEQIDRSLEDMARRYRLAGQGMDAVAYERFAWARERNAPEAEDYFEQWRHTPRDENSQCEVCEPGDQAMWLVDTGRVDEGVRLIEATLDTGKRCASEPADMLSVLAEAYLEQGRGGEAAQAHRRAVAELARTESDMAGARGRRIRLMARTGHVDRVVRFIEEDQHLLVKADTPSRRLGFLLSVGSATHVLRHEYGDRPVELREVPAGTLAELDDWVRAESQVLAAAFDARNGNSGWRDETVRAWQTEPAAVELSLEVLTAVPDPMTGSDPASPTASTDVAQEAVATPDEQSATGLLAEAEQRAAAGDLESAVQSYVAAAERFDAEGFLVDSGFAWAEAAHAAQLLEDESGAVRAYRAAVSRLVAGAAPARFVVPVVQAWARVAAGAGALDEVLGRAGEVGNSLGEDPEDVRARADLGDATARMLATLGRTGEAADLAESTAEDYARLGRTADAAHAFWLAGLVRSEAADQIDRAIWCLESAVEGFGIARDRTSRSSAANDLIALLRRTGQPARAEQVAADLLKDS